MSPRHNKKGLGLVCNEEPKGADPFKKDQIFSDMKVLEYDEKSCRSVHFVYVKRGAQVHVPSPTKGAPGTMEWSETATARDPKGNVLWETKVHMMTAADFKNHIKGRTLVEAGVIK